MIDTKIDTKAKENIKQPNQPKGQPSQPGDEIDIIIDGVEFKAKHRVFKSGRRGYGLYGMARIKNFPHRLSINLIEV
jgi:hypothetical protein